DAYDEHEIDDGRPEKRQQHEREDQLWDRHHDVDDAPEYLVDPAAQHSREKPEQAADREGQRRSQDRDAHGVAGGIDQAREHVASELIGTEPVLIAPGVEGAADKVRLGVRRDQRRKESSDQIQQDHDEAEPRRQWGAAQLAPYALIPAPADDDRLVFGQ